MLPDPPQTLPEHIVPGKPEHRAIGFHRFLSVQQSGLHDLSDLQSRIDRACQAVHRLKLPCALPDDLLEAFVEHQHLAREVPVFQQGQHLAKDDQQQQKEPGDERAFADGALVGIIVAGGDRERSPGQHVRAGDHHQHGHPGRAFCCLRLIPMPPFRQRRIAHQDRADDKAAVNPKARVVGVRKVVIGRHGVRECIGGDARRQHQRRSAACLAARRRSRKGQRAKQRPQIRQRVRAVHHLREEADM